MSCIVVALIFKGKPSKNGVRFAWRLFEVAEHEARADRFDARGAAGS